MIKNVLMQDPLFFENVGMLELTPAPALTPALLGGAGNDTLVADDSGQTTAGVNYLDGGDGNDTFYRDAANDECIAHYRQFERWVA